ncbi:hypothetical protein GQ55_4G015000 [Panicum hallii var. hallii]|uniref:Uncharacterized protein n=1 Tax=Panicum hallii var. hallii TaxID=1504633 RepID=A0A2T7DU62_9POAL|nr:hypothetical protein GQ55_4G015000 [Panicum hallii var. hallii]
MQRRRPDDRRRPPRSEGAVSGGFVAAILPAAGSRARGAPCLSDSIHGLETEPSSETLILTSKIHDHPKCSNHSALLHQRSHPEKDPDGDHLPAIPPAAWYRRSA